MADEAPLLVRVAGGLAEPITHLNSALGHYPAAAQRSTDTIHTSLGPGNGLSLPHDEYIGDNFLIFYLLSAFTSCASLEAGRHTELYGGSRARSRATGHFLNRIYGLGVRAWDDEPS